MANSVASILRESARAYAAVGAAAFWLTSCAAMQPPQTFSNLVHATEAAEPLTAGKLEALLGRPLECRENQGMLDCQVRNHHIDGVVIGDLDFVQNLSNRRSILRLQQLSGECVDAETLASELPPSELRVSCSDGPLCYYRQSERKRARISIGLGIDQHARCATSVIVDTFR